MPDLTEVLMDQCPAGLGHHTVGRHHVYLSLDGRVSCDCKDFQMRKAKLNQPCKHIKEAEAKACGWHQQYSDEVQTPEQREQHICPRCGGPTKIVRVGV